MENNEGSPLVSVVMPCYNDGQYIMEAIASVQAQTYPNIELIIVNDGSTDAATNTLLAGLQLPGCRVLQQGNKGPSAARNLGISEANGTYILPLDADDRIEPAYIAAAVREAEADPEVGIVYCRADLFDARTGLWELPDYSLGRELVENCIFVSALFRKSDWEAVGGFCQDFVYGLEDYDFWLCLLERGRKVVQLPEVYFHYRIKKQRSRNAGIIVHADRRKEMNELIASRHRDFMEANAKESFFFLRDAWLTPPDPIEGEWKLILKNHPGFAKLEIKVFILLSRIKQLFG